MQLPNLIEITYLMVIIASCLSIYIKTKRLHDLTRHKGIKAFRDAFFYWGLAFSIRFIGFIFKENFTITIISGMIFLYGLSMAGFSLVYSLVWKNFKHKRLYLLHLVAILISLLNIFFVENLMFYTQFAVLLYGIHLSYNNYKKEGDKHRFLQLYFIGLILAFTGYLVNFISGIPRYSSFMIYSYAINTFVFLIFVYGVFKIVKNG